jgi:benzoyl-CoA 2,3-dioxygenase component B
MSNVDLGAKIPNNVDLGEDKKLQRALEQWLPNYLDWWGEMGPSDFNAKDVWLRTAISVDAEGWAHFDYVKMPDYRWGIFLADPTPDRTIGFGDNMGQPAWQQVPGEHRNTLRRLIVTQGDTEPASVEQQRLLGHTAPSLYDLRNLFQVNVEEGRHLWAMVYLLHSQFGRDGREEAKSCWRAAAATRTSRASWVPSTSRSTTGSTSSCSRCSRTATASTSCWRSPRAASTRSRAPRASCSPRKRITCSSGETGVDRIVQRTAELMKQDPNEDARAQGGIPLDMIQRYLNLWFALSLDLFGGEISSQRGVLLRERPEGPLQGRQLRRPPAPRPVLPHGGPEGRHVVEEDVPLRNAMNEVLRDAYVEDCQRGVDR